MLRRDLVDANEIMGLLLPLLVSAGLILLVHSLPFLLIVSENSVCVCITKPGWPVTHSHPGARHVLYGNG